MAVQVLTEPVYRQGEINDFKTTTLYTQEEVDNKIKKAVDNATRDILLRVKRLENK